MIRLSGSIKTYIDWLVENGELDFDELDLGESLMLLDFCANNKFAEMKDIVLGLNFNFANFSSHEKFPLT